MRTALASTALNTGFSSPSEPEKPLSISKVAACCCLLRVPGSTQLEFFLRIGNGATAAARGYWRVAALRLCGVLRRRVLTALPPSVPRRFTQIHREALHQCVSFLGDNVGLIVSASFSFTSPTLRRGLPCTAHR